MTHTHKLIRWLWIIPALALLAAHLLPAAPAQADQALPPYAWYAVAHTVEDDTLHWISPLGEVATLARPHLPNESPSAMPQMRIAPNGQYLVLAAELNNTNQGIGIFNLGTGAWVQTHEAQPGETIFLGSEDSFSFATGRVAVGFMSGDYQNPAWRVIVFDLASGNATAVLDHTNPQAPSGQLAIPRVKYYGIDEGLGEEEVHIQFIPYGTEGGEIVPATRWLPFPAPANQAAAVTPSPYTRLSSDVSFLSGEEVFAFNDANYGTLPPQGPAPSYNALGRETPQLAIENATTFWVDGTSWNFSAEWANSDQWALYWSSNDQNVENWNIVLADGAPNNNQRTQLGPLDEVAGTPDGALLVDQGGTIRFTNNIADANGTALFTPNAPVNTDIIYVTPAGVQFTLTSLGDLDIVAVPAGPGDVAPPVTVQPAGPNDIAPPVQSCPGAPPARLAVGEQARVTFTNGTPLNIRANPGGNQLAQIDEGTVVDVIGGPQCQGEYTWWQISVVQGAAVNGWAAEGDLNDYYLEPWDGVVVNPGVVNPGVVQAAPTATPPVLIFVTPVGNGGNPGDITVGDCSQAPALHVQVGQTVLTAPSDGTYSFFNSLNDEFPTNQVPPDVFAQIVGGPGCKNGYRMWRIQVDLGGQLVTGWISEGTQQKYFINPVQ